MEVGFEAAEITAAGVVFLYGVAQTLILEYFWFVKNWFQKLEPGQKRFANAVGLTVVTVAVYGLSFAGVIDSFTPDVAGALKAVGVLVGALTITQGVHAGTKGMTPRKKPTPES
jgi:hypothetical protein